MLQFSGSFLFRVLFIVLLFVFILSGKGSQSCLERGRGPGLIAAYPYPF